MQVLVITHEERQEPDLLLLRLKQSPWQLLFDTSAFSSSNVRQVLLRVHPDAEQTSYNSSALMRQLLAPENNKPLRRFNKSEREAWRSQWNAASATAVEVEVEVEVEEEVEVEVEVEEEVDVDAMSCSDGVEVEDDDVRSS